MREHAIEFANWINESRFRKDFHTDNWERTFSYRKPEIKTSEELYEMFMKSKTN